MIEQRAIDRAAELGGEQFAEDLVEWLRAHARVRPMTVRLRMQELDSACQIANLVEPTGSDGPPRLVRTNATDPWDAIGAAMRAADVQGGPWQVEVFPGHVAPFTADERVFQGIATREAGKLTIEDLLPSEELSV